MNKYSKERPCVRERQSYTYNSNYQLSECYFLELVHVHVKDTFPTCISLLILRYEFLVGLNDVDLLQCGECLVMILVDTCAHTCALGCTY